MTTTSTIRKAFAVCQSLVKYETNCSGIALNLDFGVQKTDRLPMNHHIKRFLFKYYALISLAIFIGSVVCFIFGPLTWPALAAIEAGVVSFALGVF